MGMIEGKSNCATLSHNFKMPYLKGATVSHLFVGMREMAWQKRLLTKVASVVELVHVA